MSEIDDLLKIAKILNSKSLEDREVVVRHVSEGFQDSIELGTPAKGGAIKVYGDFSNPAEFEKKIRVALELRNKYGGLDTNTYNSKQV